MKAEILAKWQEAAQELWEETPEFRSQYNHDLAAYLNWNRTRLEAREEWWDNPGLQKEFSGDFNRFLAYKKAESQGSVNIIGKG